MGVIVYKSNLSQAYKKILFPLIIIVVLLLLNLIGAPAVERIEAFEPAASGFLGGFGLPIILSWIVGGVIAGLVAYLIGKITLGLRSDYLAIATLGIAEVIIYILKNEDWLTRGVKNVNGLPRPVPYEIDLQESTWFIELCQNFGFPLVVKKVRETIGENVPLFVRISAEDGLDGGWTIEDSINFCHILREQGVDVVDCSSGGNSSKGATASGQKRKSGFQVPFAAKIKKEVGIKTQAVGLIRTYDFANTILQEEKADLIALGRQHLFNPFWTNQAREIANQNKDFKEWPQQYRWWLSKWKSALSDINEKP